MTRIQGELRRLRSSPLLRNAGWMMAGQIAGYVLQGVYFVILARLLGALEYGIFAGAFAFVNLIGKYSQLGTGTVFLRYVSIDRSNFSLYWGNVLLITGAGGVVMTVILQVLGLHILNPASAAVVFLAAIANCFGTQLTACAAQVFQAIEQMKVTAILNLLTNFLRTAAAGTLLLLFRRVDAWHWALVSTAVSLIGSVLAVTTITFRLGRPRASMELLRRRLVEGFSYAFANSSTSAYNDLDKAMLSHYGMNEANGIYTLAYRAIDIASMPVYSVVNAALPHFFREGTKGISATARLAIRLWKRAILLALAASASMFIFAPLIPHFAGRSFGTASVALRWLCLIPVFRSVHDVLGFALTSAGLQRYRTSVQVVAVALNLALNIWLIPTHSWRGAAWSSLATDGSLCLMNWGLLTFFVRRSQRQALCQSVCA
jgi:O-antigen/teichoic acid export membrane protein